MKLSAARPVRWATVSQCRYPMHPRGRQRKFVRGPGASDAGTKMTPARRYGAIERSFEALFGEIGHQRTDVFAARQRLPDRTLTAHPRREGIGRKRGKSTKGLHAPSLERRDNCF